MSEIISKELLGEVLGVEIDSIQGLNKDNYLMFKFKIDNGKLIVNEAIDIHRIAHKCKEKAIEKKYWLDSGIRNIKLDSIKEKGYCYIKDFNHDLDDFYKNGKEEYEAIIKAYQWILDNKGNS